MNKFHFLCKVLLPLHITIFVIIAYMPNDVFAYEKEKIPRFATIKYDHANVRKCPKEDCPIEWEFIQKGEPVMVMLKTDEWYKIVDIKNEGGWIHSRLLSNKRGVVINSKNTIPLLASPEKYHKIVAMVAPKLRCGFKKCVQGWCQVVCRTKTGWIPGKDVWGVFENEWKK